MRARSLRTGLAALAAAALCPGAALAAGPADARLARELSALSNRAGQASGVYVLNATERSTLFQRRAGTRRILASNAKLFTTAASLERLGGPDATLDTLLLTDGELDPATGVLDGDLYLRGGGDPTFGSAAFSRRNYAGGGSVEALARALAAAGVTLVRGRVVGDESIFDARRGGPSGGFGYDRELGGALSGLAYDRGLANSSGTAFQANPPAFAAARLTAALEAGDIDVRGRPRPGPTPAGARELARTASPPLARLAQITNKRSDNYFAEMLLKLLAARAGSPGTTRDGAGAASGFARSLGATVRLTDGSGLSRGDLASPQSVARLLDRMRTRPAFDAFLASLAVAGRDGTLHDRMESGAARGRCFAKTGTLSNVSALSGYCDTRGGDVLVFSILQNRVRPHAARRLQDRMVQRIAAYAG